MGKGLRFTDEANTAVSDYTYRRDVFALGPRQKITRTLEFRCARRGYYRIDQAGLDVRSLLLTKKYVGSTPQATDFYVLPRLVSTQRIQIPFSQIMGNLTSRQEGLRRPPLAFAGLRGYVRGDPMKYINWKATAKTGQLLVNLHESTLSLKVAVVLDLEGPGRAAGRPAQRGGGAHRLHAVCAAAGGGHQGQRLLQRVGRPQRPAHGGCRRSPAQAACLALRKAFACAQAANGLEPIEGFFPSGEGQRDENSLLCVLVTRDQRESLARAFAQRAASGSGCKSSPTGTSTRKCPSSAPCAACIGKCRERSWQG